jgi:16S rRNA (guanine966-N2)-methyltransferase
MRIGAGRWRNAALPDAGEDVRPVPARLRTSLFSVLHTRIAGASVLDLCAGVGGLSLEAVSRGAFRAVLVERDRRIADALRAWVAKRRAGDLVKVVAADAARGRFPAGPYDLVFLDPPYSAWEGDGRLASDLLARAVENAARDGVVAVKLPAKAAIPLDPRWVVRDRRSQGTVAYALLFPVAATLFAKSPLRGGDPGQAAPGADRSTECRDAPDRAGEATPRPRPAPSARAESRRRESAVHPAPEPKAGTSLARGAGADPALASHGAGAPGEGPAPERRRLRPIGPEALKALRDAIRSGKYPPEDAVVGGLVRMMRPRKEP